MKYVFLDDKYDTGHILMRDLEDDKECRVIYRDRLRKNRFLNRLLGPRTQHALRKMSLGWLWYRLVLCRACGSDTRVITMTIYWYDTEMVDFLKKAYPKAKLVFLLRDTVQSKIEEIEGFSIEWLKQKFDLILSYDQIHDVPVYGLTYAPVFMSKIEEIAHEQTACTYDIALMAVAKDRLQTIHKLYHHLVGKGVKAFFFVSHADPSDQLKDSGIVYAAYNMKRLDYLKKEMASNCILEVLKGDAHSNTLRFWEAVMYNKKLYTNWKGVLDSPYYDPRYIKVFDQPEDMDISFIQERIQVDYHYGGELSPLNLLAIFHQNWKTNFHNDRMGFVWMLHHVTEKNPNGIPSNQVWRVSPAFLEKMIVTYQQKGYDFISLDTLSEILSSGRQPERPFIALTLDDGYLDNYTNAFPIFQKYQIPFCIFVATDFVDQKAILWWDCIEELVLSHEKVTTSDGIIYPCHTARQKRKTYYHLQQTILRMDQSRLGVDELNELLGAYKIDWLAPIRRQGLSWEQVKTLSNHPLCTIGGHTVSHPAFDALSDDDIRREIREGVEKIEALTGKPVHHFAYPYGSPRIIGDREYQLLKEFSFKTAFCSYGGWITMNHQTAPDHLPRIGLYE